MKEEMKGFARMNAEMLKKDIEDLKRVSISTVLLFVALGVFFFLAA